MGFLKGLLGLGVTAGAAFAALKVAQKYEENKAADAAAAAAGAEPQDVPAGSVLEDIARAAGGVLSDAGAKVKEVVTGTAEKAGVDTCLLYTSCVNPHSAIDECPVFIILTIILPPIPLGLQVF